MATVKKLGNFTGNDIELCSTTNEKAGNQTIQALVNAHNPFTRNSKRIPFYKREQYNGAREFTVISINPHRYGQARRVVDQMDTLYRRRLVVTNY